MNTLCRQLLWFLSLFLVWYSVNAAPFQNLGFDDGNTNGVRFIGPASQLLPGWKVFSGNAELSQIGLDAVPLSSPADFGFASLITSNFWPWRDIPQDGFALVFKPGHDERGRIIPMFLRQSGDVPPDAKSLWFTSYLDPLELKINGNLLDEIDGINGWSFDISLFAGQTVELEISPKLNLPYPYSPEFAIDSILFSPVPVPEPATCAIFTFGLLTIGVNILRRRG